MIVTYGSHTPLVFLGRIQHHMILHRLYMGYGACRTARYPSPFPFPSHTLRKDVEVTQLCLIANLHRLIQHSCGVVHFGRNMRPTARMSRSFSIC